MSTANLVEKPNEHIAIAAPQRSKWLSSLLPALIVAIAALSTLGGLYAVGRMPRLERQAALNSETAEAIASRPRVNVTAPYRRDKPSDLTLPGDIKAAQDTEIYARTDGYIKRYLVDIGEKVQANALLAEIDAPELDQELKQAQATLEQSKANLNLVKSRLALAKVTLNRSMKLMARGSETQQVVDEDTSQYRVAEATVSTAEAEIEAKQANVNRLVELQKFEKVYAPYSGVITAKNINIGDLIKAGMTQPMFRLAQTDSLKIYVNVPQTNVNAIKIGMNAEVLVRENPERPFIGKVTRTAGAIDTASRTLLTEILLPNPDGKLYAGMYVKVRFAEAGGRPLLIPATTLAINAQGTRVATVRPDGSISYKTVQLGRDYGQEVEILNGLEGNEQLVLNPTENLVEGMQVEAVANPPAVADPTKPTAAKK